MILSRDNPTPSSIPPTLSPWRISTERYLEMIQDGVLDETDHVELINGMIIDMSPGGTKHAYIVNRLVKLFAPICGELELWVQSTMVIGEGQVYDPDFALLKPRPAEDSYKHRHPDPADVALLIEVAASSLAKDRDVKLPVYAKAGVPEVWLVDIESESVQVCREPGEGGFAAVEVVEKGRAVSAGCLAGESIKVESIFG